MGERCCWWWEEKGDTYQSSFAFRPSPLSFAFVPYERKSCIQKGFTLDTTTTTEELIFIESV